MIPSTLQALSLLRPRSLPALCFLGLIFALSPLPVFSQSPARDQPVTFRVIAIGDGTAGLFYDVEGKKPVPIHGQDSMLSPPYQRPLTGVLSVYKIVPSNDPAKPAQHVTVAETPIGTNGPYLVILSSPNSHQTGGPGKITMQVVEDSWSAHPAQTVRVLNFSQHRTAIQLGADMMELIPGQSHVSTAQGDTDVIDFKVAIWENGTWELRTQSPQMMIRRTRHTFVITDVLPSRENPHPDSLNITNIIDSAQPPKKS